jgi:hypothetical protein
LHIENQEVKITEKETEKTVINDWDNETLAKLFRLQISHLKNKGFILEKTAEILEEKMEPFIDKILKMPPFSDLEIPFVIIPNSEDPYCLVDVVCDHELSEMIYKESRKRIVSKGRHFLNEGELLIFEKIIGPLIMHPTDSEKEFKDDTGSLVMRDYWIYTTSYVQKIHF